MNEVISISEAEVSNAETRQRIVKGRVDSVLAVAMQPSHKTDEIKEGGVVAFRGRYYEVDHKEISSHTTSPLVTLALLDIGSVAFPKELEKWQAKRAKK